MRVSINGPMEVCQGIRTFSSNINLTVLFSYFVLIIFCQINSIFFFSSDDYDRMIVWVLSTISWQYGQLQLLRL